jgi:hypothetical protein
MIFSLNFISSLFGGYEFWWIIFPQFGVSRSQGMADWLACYGTCIALALGIFGRH